MKQFTNLKNKSKPKKKNKSKNFKMIKKVINNRLWHSESVLEVYQNLYKDNI